MRTLAVTLAILMAAAAPAIAAKKKHRAPPPPAPISQNEASWRLVKEGVPGFLPFGIGTFYLATQSDTTKKK